MPTLTLNHNDKTLGGYRLQTGHSLTIGRRNKNDVVIGELITTSRWLKNGDVINIGEHALIFQNSAGEKASLGDTDELDKTTVIDTIQYRNMRKKSNPTRSINVVRFWSKSQKPGIKKKMIPGISKPIVAETRKEPISSLTYLAGGKGKIKLTKKTTTIGKHPKSDIVVKGLWVGKTAVSISKRPDGYYLCYLGFRCH
jgi:pSer/pThr/pTyr-binding forkhead associated (FHA) protein